MTICEAYIVLYNWEEEKEAIYAEYIQTFKNLICFICDQPNLSYLTIS